MNSYKNVIIFGTGRAAEIGCASIDSSIYHIQEVWDNSEQRIGQMFQNCIIRKPHAHANTDVIVIMSQWVHQITQQLLSLGYPEEKIFDSFYFRQQLILKYFEEHPEEADSDIYAALDEIKKALSKSVSTSNEKKKSVLPNEILLNCTGCSACYAICPKHCISMSANDEGFLYPHINEANCIHCQKCQSVCPVLDKKQNSEKSAANSYPLTFAVKNKDDSIRMKSSSGGIFSLLATSIINNKGIVYGAAFSDDYKSLHHIGVENLNDLEKLYQSKYFQSDMENIYSEVKEMLENKRDVLFSGTPCQIKGLYSFLGDKPYNNLLTQDLVCYGVPSPLVWKLYLEYLEKKFGTSVAVSFRNKTRGWENYSIDIKFAEGKKYSESGRHDLYMNAFNSGLLFRPSCYQCKYSTIERCADITLADLWGAKQIVPDFFDEKGISLVLINTQKGEHFFQKYLSNTAEYQKISVHDAAKYNQALRQPSDKHPKRNIFYQRLMQMPIEKNLFQSTNYDVLIRALENDKHIKEPLNVVLFGTGSLAEREYPFISPEKYIVLEFWDNNLEKENTIYFEKTVKLPYKGCNMNRIVIFSQWFEEIRNQLMNLGYPEDKILPWEYFYIQNFFEY